MNAGAKSIIERTGADGKLPLHLTDQWMPSEAKLQVAVSWFSFSTSALGLQWRKCEKPRWPHCTGSHMALTTTWHSGHIIYLARLPILHSWPYCTTGYIAQLAMYAGKHIAQV